MSVVQILEQFDFSSYPEDGWWVLLPPQTQDLRLKILNLKCNAQRSLGGDGLLRWAQPEELSNESPDTYAEKVWKSEWMGEHYRIDLYMFGQNKEVIINSLPIVNRGFPYDRDMLSNTSTPGGYFDLQQGFGLKVKFVDNGFGTPPPIPGQFVAIFGTGQSGSDSFSAPQINVDATTSVTNTADGQTIKSGMLPKANWELSGSESAPWAPGATYYEYTQGDLLYIADGDETTKWESATNGNSHDKKIKIHLGKEYQINGIRIKTGDFPNKLKGRVLVSTDMGTWREVYPLGFLEGDINFAKVAARWVSIETKVQDNTPYEQWHIYQISLFGDITQETETANNPILSPFTWVVEHIYWGDQSANFGNPPVERLPANNYGKIDSDGEGSPHLVYHPFQTVFPSNFYGEIWTPEEKMHNEICGLEIDLGKNFDIELVDAQFETSPKQWRGYLYGSKDGADWISLASGFISELKNTAINFSQCRFLRVINDRHANVANGLNTPPRLNKLNVYASVSMQQIEPITTPTEPSAITTAVLRLDLSGNSEGLLTSTSGFTLVSGGVAPTVLTENGKKHIQWRYPNNSVDMHLVHPQTAIKGILAEVKSPTSFWGHNNQSGWSFDGFFGGINPDTLIFRFREGNTTMDFFGRVVRVLRNSEEINAPYDLTPINQWMWILIEFDDTYTADWMLGRASLSGWRTDCDIRQFMGWETTPSDSEIDEVIAYLS
ncbi:MAG: discoidin domain-containing protein [Roseofilum sp. SBFL]|uniref:discoidin domain-containing protein n=1 Tax=Roseofilum sp. SBFL TaxID=2821496 RepID=UPI001B2E3F6F|nr:discoidin domain-containing protein [Roseofilum sp. SBFL]MBP0043383.1 discoidin domain-containing protein [Roseofilum sp. SBFL]